MVASMDVDADRLWRAIEACDPRFDGWVYCGVKTTGIYCRPSCPARTPKRENVRFFPSAAAAQAAGFRACKRCRPDATPGSPEWDLRADLVGRAMRLIADGVVNREGVAGLARRLGYSERHLHRQLVAVVGAGPLALARAQRAQTARVLIETTKLPITEVAFAAGFQSGRQFNATVQEIFALTPSALRTRAQAQGRAEDSGAVSLTLPCRAPFDGAGVIAFLARRVVSGVEEVDNGTYRRSVLLPRGPGTIEVRAVEDRVLVRFRLADLRDLATAMQRSRSLLDLDSDPQTVAELLGRAPALGALVREAPGRRVVGCVDSHELAVRAVLGQQVSVRSATSLAALLVGHYGERLDRPLGGVTHVFPTVAALVGAARERVAMPLARYRGLQALVSALHAGDLEVDGGADRTAARRQLLALPGIGSWTAEYIAMRAMRDPDAFLPTDVGVRRGLDLLARRSRPAAARQLAERWRPYRSYAVQHLWASLEKRVPAMSDSRRASAGALAA
jgi:AraC family transcriptional regulator of adaptative response / DNA-3-methyladenine glycosylase II